MGNVSGGPLARPRRTILPRNCPRSGAKPLSSVNPRTCTTSAAIGPGVGGDHGPAAAMKFAPYGSTRRTQTLRCCQPSPNSPQLSFVTCELPAAVRRSIAHETARDRPGEPVSRGPMPSSSSVAYVITCERAVPSSRMWRYICRSGASTSTITKKVVSACHERHLPTNIPADSATRPWGSERSGRGLDYRSGKPMPVSRLEGFPLCVVQTLGPPCSRPDLRLRSGHPERSRGVKACTTHKRNDSVRAASGGRRRRWRPIDAERQTGEHHLFPGLIAPPHVLRWIGIRLVRRRVVVPRHRVELRPLRQLERLLELVVGLPLEVVVRHGEDRLRPAVRIGDVVAPPPAAHVRMREHRP